MNILFYLSHPAHFHLFKNIISSIDEHENSMFILIRKKDVLEDLLLESNIDYTNISNKYRRENFFSLGLGLLKEDFKVLKYSYRKKIDVIVGTSPVVSHIGFILRIRSLIVTEDDSKVVPLLAYTAYPFATSVITPDVCDNGIWEYKSKKYRGYHELAYLHPDYFTPSISIINKYFKIKKPYFIIRFSKLGGHHDKGIKGLNDKVAIEIIKKLKPIGKVIITSERKLSSNFEKYRLAIKPFHMHDILAFSSLYIGDSQTMAAEAGVLGVPFIRFNDFVGKIGYLKDIEDKYKLGYGIKPDKVNELFKTLDNILEMKDRENIYRKRRDKMFLEKIDVTKFLKDLILFDKDNE